MRNVFYISIGISLAIVVAALAHYRWRTHQLREPLARVSDVAVAEASSQVKASVTVPRMAYSLYEPVPIDSGAAAPVLGHASNKTRLETVLDSLSADEQKEFKRLLRKAEALLEEVEELYAQNLEEDRISEEWGREIAELNAELEEIQRENRNLPPIDYNPDYFGEDVPNFNDPK